MEQTDRHPSAAWRAWLWRGLGPLFMALLDVERVSRDVAGLIVAYALRLHCVRDVQFFCLAPEQENITRRPRVQPAFAPLCLADGMDALRAAMRAHHEHQLGDGCTHFKLVCCHAQCNTTPVFGDYWMRMDDDSRLLSVLQWPSAPLLFCYKGWALCARVACHG